MSNQVKDEAYWNSPEGLREQAAYCRNDNQGPGQPGDCVPSEANWTLEELKPEQLTHVFASQAEAQAWIASEIEMDESDEMHREWRRLLTEDIREEVVVFIRKGDAHVWDGWHRIAASIARGISVKAIVGRDILAEVPQLQAA